MSIQVILILLLTGLMAGTLSGSLGIGGGIIVVPALVFFLGLSQHEAQGTSLLTMLAPIGILGAMNYYKAGHVNIKYALIIACAFILGSWIGSSISIQIHPTTLRRFFGFFFLLVGLKMALGR